jgi:hypothetical protein
MDSENTEKIIDKRRANLRPPWQAGQVTNPKGRGKGNVSIVSAIRRVLREKLPNETKRTQVDLFAEALIQNARRGNGTAIKEIMARIDGAIPNVHEGGDPEKPVLVHTVVITRCAEAADTDGD